MERGALANAQSAWLWWLSCATVAAVSLIAWQLPVEVQLALRWRADSAASAPWTWWSASLMHLSHKHLGLNVLTLLGLAMLGAWSGAGTREALAVLLAWPLSTVGLGLWPQVGGYAGLSGLNHAVAVVILIHSASQARAKQGLPWLALALGAALIGKLLWEQAWSQPMRADATWGFKVVQAVHLSGFVSGALCYAIMTLLNLLSLRRFTLRKSPLIGNSVIDSKSSSPH